MLSALSDKFSEGKTSFKDFSKEDLLLLITMYGSNNFDNHGIETSVLKFIKNKKV